MLFLMRCFSEGAKVLLRKSEVAQRYLSSSGVIPSCSRCYHLRYMLSRAFIVWVYFFTNWNSTGTLFIFKLLLNFDFLLWNYSSSLLDHLFSKNSLLSLIFTFVNSLSILLCTLCCRRVTMVLLRTACDFPSSNPSLVVVLAKPSKASSEESSLSWVSSLSKSLTFSSSIS